MILYLIRGTSGSGKTTLAQYIAPGSNVCTDDYFKMNGVFRFDPSRLGEMHERCFKRCVFLMSKGFGVVAVHNAFTLLEHLLPYVQAGEDAGYEVKVVRVRSSQALGELEKRNVHGCPLSGIQRQEDSYEVYVGESIHWSD